MSFDIQIKVDTNGAPTAIASVTDALGKTETKADGAQRALDALSESAASLKTALEAENAAFDRLVKSQTDAITTMNAAARASDTWQAAALREREMLEQIQGPLREYEKDLQALDSLMSKGAITTQQYADQVQKLNQRIGERPEQMGEQYGPVQQAPQAESGGVLSGLGATAGVIAGTGAGLLMVARGIESLLDEQRKLEDEYTNLTNEAEKFATSGKSVSEVMIEQADTARAMHVTLDQSMKTYEGVRNALMDVTLTSGEMAKATRTVGEAARLANKPVESAGEILNRVILAFNSGADAGRALKSVMIEYPALGNLLKAAYATDEAGLLRLAQAHKLTAQGIADALASETNAVTDEFGKRKVTHEQQIAMYKEQANVLRQEGVPALVAYSMAGNETFKSLHDGIQNPNKAVDEATAKILELAEETSKLRGRFKDVGDAEGKAFGGMIDDVNAATGAIGMLGNAVSRALGKDAWAGINDKTGLLKFLPLGIKTAMDFTHAVDENKAAIDDLNAAYVAGAFGKPDSAVATGIFLEKLEQLTAGIKKQKDALVEHHKALQQDDAGALALKSDLEDWHRRSEDISKKSEQVARDLAEWAKQMQEDIKKTQEEAARARGERLTKEWRAEIEQTDKAIAAMKDDAKMALDPLKQAFSDLITKGKADWSAMFDQIASNGVNKLLDQGEKSLLDSVFGQTSQEAALTTSFETGGLSAATAISTAMETAGGIVATQIGAAIAGGGAASGLGGILGAADIAGQASSAATASTALDLGTTPMFATGGSGYVGGRGGTDSQLFVARVTPGEHYQFTPPGQTARSSSGGGHTIVNLNYDPRAIRSGKDIEDGVMAVIRKNPSAIRALIGR